MFRWSSFYIEHWMMIMCPTTEESEEQQAYWEKSQENLIVCENAYKDMHLNAAASRYYYALMQAVMSYFAAIGVKIPNDHTRFRNKAIDVIDLKIVDIGQSLFSAHTLRYRGDYKTNPVTKIELDMVQKQSRDVFKELENEINEKQ